MNHSDHPAYPGIMKAILHTAAYADVFDYPLTAIELHHYLIGCRAPREAVEQVLAGGEVLANIGGYYPLPGRDAIVGERARREQQAAQMWPSALGYGRVIAGLPFVRMVAVTGSLAMNNVAAGAATGPDIDYLVVTAPGRLWMVRALGLAVARLAALQGVRLCPNYLVSEQALVFPDRSLYAAHELAQMIPLSGQEVYQRICALNRWKEVYLPNANGLPPAMPVILQRDATGGLKPLVEAALRLPPGSWVERWEMQRKIRRLAQEQSESPESCFGADFCKGHAHQHGRRTERGLRERLESLRLEQPV